MCKFLKKNETNDNEMNTDKKMDQIETKFLIFVFEVLMYRKL
jgi:hypothetical protein